MDGEQNSKLSINALAEKYIKMFEQIGDITEKKGARYSTTAVAILILIIILIKQLVQFLNFKKLEIDYTDIILLICAMLIIVTGLVIGLLQYKVDAEVEKSRLDRLFEKYKMELEYNIKRLEMTDTSNIETNKQMQDSEGKNEQKKI